MALELKILLGFLLDQLLGDPRVLPHPVNGIAALAKWLEHRLRRTVRKAGLAGILTVVMVVLITGLIVFALLTIAGLIHPIIKTLFGIYLLFSSFAARDLVHHAMQVHKALEQDDLPEARKRVAMIVGRDTSNLDRAGVVRACVESVAENLVDGVTAPLFWATLFGPLGALCYKAINTMDSLFGYKNDKYLEFGWAAARLDDLVNWLPARLTGLLMVVSAAFLGLRPGLAWRIWLRDRDRHTSPNAGQSEAAMAGALGVQLGGSNIYFGTKVDKPCIGDPLTEVVPGHIVQANRVMILTSVLFGALLLGGRMVLL